MVDSTRPGFGLAEIRALVARRWWLFLLPFLAISIGTTVIAYTLPDVYRTETVILVDQAKIPPDIIRPISTLSGKDRLATLSTQLMSRTRLEQVIRTLKLWPEAWDDPVAMERKINSLKRKIEVQVNGDDSFTIAFEGEDPARVQQVANQLAQIFIDTNRRFQEQQASETTEFIEAQIREVEARLQAKDQEIKRFREENLGQLPEQKEVLYRQVDNLEARLAANREATLRLTERRAMVQQQMEAVRARLQQPEEVSPLRQELVKLHAELQLLESQFTSKHPDVVMARRRIAEIEGQLRSGRGSVQLPPLSGAQLPNDPMYVGLKRELDGIAVDLSSRAAERQMLERQLQEATVRVAGLPTRQARWEELTRDLQNARDTYNGLLNKLQQARLGSQVNVKQAGQTFQVLDPADLPKTPVRPNRAKIILVGLVLGLAAGGGGAYLAEMLDQSIRTVEQLKAAYNLPVLGAIPDLAQDEGKARRRARRRYLARQPQAAQL
jgi:succinoglycan biosynthesis transport protein ExoP